MQSLITSCVGLNWYLTQICCEVTHSSFVKILVSTFKKYVFLAFDFFVDSAWSYFFSSPRQRPWPPTSKNFLSQILFWGVNVKGFPRLLYSIAHRTLSPQHVNIIIIWGGGGYFFVNSLRPQTIRSHWRWPFCTWTCMACHLLCPRSLVYSTHQSTPRSSSRLKLQNGEQLIVIIQHT